MKHSNISIFIPHLGCPFNCIFCDQYKITGSDSAVTPLTVDSILKDAAFGDKPDPKTTQIAFFGGSFTALDKKLMVEYLKTAYKYIESGHFESIRISTRPDCIDEETLEILKKYKVKTIELGIQSFDDEVLFASKRGHKADVALKACELINNYGFELGLQMMCGLPEDTFEKDLYTANQIIKTGCKQVRIYPVVVIAGTALANMYLQGKYKPLDLEEAVERCAKLYSLFRKSGVTILKMGLHTDSDSIAGPFHPAFGELVRSYAFYEHIKSQINKNEKVEILVQSKYVSIATGNKRCNLSRFESEGYKVKIITDNNIGQPYIIKKSSEL